MLVCTWQGQRIVNIARGLVGDKFENVGPAEMLKWVAHQRSRPQWDLIFMGLHDAGAFDVDDEDEQDEDYPPLE